LHPDHIGGLMTGDKPTFPNATVHADKRDPDLWLNQALMEAAPKEGMNGQRRFRFAMTSLNAYVAAGKLKTFDGATELAPGINTVAAPGHTLGHTMYAFESKGQKLLLWGDLVVSQPIQFATPEVTTQFDSNGKLAASQRDKFYLDASAKGYWVAGAHLSFPGLGHVRKEDGRYVFVPAVYSALR
jgi:glyoxylase-like metal-dependent hydrolase (beta-lactamase superfamily II)